MYTWKIKCTLLQALRFCTGLTVHRGSRGIALLFLGHGTRSGEESASRPGRSLPPGNNRYPLYRRLGGSQARCGQVRKISPLPTFDPRTVQLVASRCTYYTTRHTCIHDLVVKCALANSPVRWNTHNFIWMALNKNSTFTITINILEDSIILGRYAVRLVYSYWLWRIVVN